MKHSAIVGLAVAVGILGPLATIKRLAAQERLEPPVTARAANADTLAVDFPPTTGTHRVGRASYHLIDKSRPEVFTTEPDDLRELMVTVHYPADVADDEEPSPYADDKLAAAIAEAYRLPPSFAQRMHSHAVDNAPCARQENGFPVVLFSPGFKNHPLFYTALLEELASQGFVVVSICHPYSTGVVVYPDGRTVLANDSGTQFELDKKNGDVDPQTVTAHRDAIGEIWQSDVRFVADELARLNKQDKLLAGALNLSRLGVFGHSFGGAAAVATVARDQRFRAGINLDGSDFSGTRGKELAESCLWLCSQPPNISQLPPDSARMRREGDKGDKNAPPPRPPSAGAAKASGKSAIVLKRPGDPDLPPLGPSKRPPTIYDGMHSPPGARITIAGFRHQTFESDAVLLAAASPLAQATAGVGQVDSHRAVLIVNSLVDGFFRRRLRDEATTWLDDPSSRFAEAVRDQKQP